MISSPFYKADYEYLINVRIQEYDISKANISVLRQHNIIDDDQYNAYCQADKHEREVEMGVWFKQQPHLCKLMQQTVAEAREWFLTENNIEDHQVLYTDNDSITIIDAKSDIKPYKTQYTEFIGFKMKTIYSSFYRLGPIDFLYYGDQNTESYRFKYANSEKLISLHKNGFLDLLLTLADTAQTSSFQQTVLMVKDVYRKYVNKEFPIEYYREFNQRSQFKLTPGYAFQYYSDIPPNGLDDTDISYNANLLRQLSRVFHKEYFREKR